ncbi:cation:proton antiporter [Nocardioides mesophilus]|uniref:cation:proton antiporter n=1 Tax=Nocardioides mesophilus TaxID=433659 RepID=UPI001CB72F03|nr:cation:proton antiporter [Nocardioides mesophilus]
MTALVLTFAIALLLAVLTSSLASRSALSTTLVFLVVGMVAGPLGLGVVDVSSKAAEKAAEIALFAILFTDGQHAPLRVLRRNWGPPTRALLVAMPLTFAIVAALGHWVAGLPWPAALVLGAVLAPTDPVFASALVGREDVPQRVRHMLNIESGLNDGLALPAVLVFVGLAGGTPEEWSTEPWTLVLEVLVGIALGVVIPIAVVSVLRLPGVGAVPSLLPLGPLALALLLYGVCELTHANSFLAAFVAGSTVATIRPTASDSFRRTGELVSEMAKGAALIAFASLLDRELLVDAGIAGLVLAAAVLLVSRPLPVMAVMVGSRLTMKEQLAVAWFGPKGFASVAYAVIVLFSGMQDAGEVFVLVGVTVLFSVVAHSSTDVAVASWLSRDEDKAVERGDMSAEPLGT